MSQRDRHLQSRNANSVGEQVSCDVKNINKFKGLSAVAGWHVACFADPQAMAIRVKHRMGRRPWLAGLFVALGACVSPTLPPDDPPEPRVELGVGVARLTGHIGEGPAFVLVHNRDTGLVFGQRTAFGDYDFEVPTEPCDLLAFWYTAGLFQSTQVLFRPADLAERRGVCATTGAVGDAGLPETE